MLRRGFLRKLMAQLRREGKVPTDSARLNHFSDAYNDYVAKLNAGVLDVKAWEKARKEWNRLV